jgi:hypothetical protein
MTLDASLLVDQDVRVAYRSVLADSEEDGTVGEMSFELEAEGYSLWAGTASEVEDFDAWPEVTLASGDVEVQWEDDCGTHLRRLLLATREDSTEAIATGTTYGFDGIGVWSGGIVDDVATECPGYVGTFASAVMWTLTDGGT